MVTVGRAWGDIHTCRLAFTCTQYRVAAGGTSMTAKLGVAIAIGALVLSCSYAEDSPTEGTVTTGEDSPTEGTVTTAEDSPTEGRAY